TDAEVVTDPEVTLAIEHRFSSGAITAAVKLERQNPGTWFPVEVRHVRNCQHVVRRRYLIELAQQRVDSLRLVPRGASNRLRRCQRIGRRGPLRSCRGGEQVVARIRCHARYATG